MKSLELRRALDQFFKTRYYVSLKFKSFSEMKTSDKPVSNSTNNGLDLSFSDYKTSYKSLSTFQVLRGYIVYSLSSSPFLVNNSLKLMEIFKRIFGQNIYKSVMKMTFYGQFVAGEDLNKIKPLLTKLDSVGVHCMLDYCVEEDISEDFSISGLDIPKYGDKEYDVSSRFIVRKSRSAFYKDEANSERTLDILQQAVFTMSKLKLDKSILAVKMTSLGRPEMLLQLSEVIMQARKFVADLLGVKGHKNIVEYKLTDEVLRQKLEEIGIKDMEVFMKNIVRDSSGIIHLFPWYGIVDGSKGLSETFRVPSLKEKRMVRLLTQLSTDEEEMFRNMIRRLEVLLEVAKAYKVMVVIDAEQSYFQTAINRITLELMNIHNKEKVSILNTYQCYLKNTLEEIHCDLALAKRQGFTLATKLVRGAYMDQERTRAKLLNYKDPIVPDFDACTKMFNEVTMECLQQIGKGNKIFALIASHNEDTLRFAIEQMTKFGIKASDNTIGFGQLLGMKDYVTFPLAEKGYLVYKYIPYGPVVKVMPYLARRVEENRGKIFQGSKDCQMYGKELKRRILRRK